MRKRLITMLATLPCIAAMAQTPGGTVNMPLIQTKYTADPAPYVHGDTVYLYTTHDEDDAEGFKMKDWLLYTSTDMVNWTDRGAVASLKDFKWYKGDNGAWAEQVIERNGKWYMYCPIHGHGIGVLVADSPYGPFTDPLGKPLVWQKEHWYDIDPTVWIDDDGQAYMYWGNPNLYCVKLNEDMISYSGDIVEFPKIDDYQEGPWFWKRNSHYYMAFASTCCPEGIGYAMSKGPMGPWEYKGHIMDHTHRTRGNHPGIIDYKGRSYCFGLNYDIFRLETSRHAERRSVSAAEMTYNADGTIQQLPYFQDCQLRQVEWQNPYKRVEAETMAWGYGLKTEVRNPWGRDRYNQYVTSIDDGEHLLVKGVDFGNGATMFTACAQAQLMGGTVELHLDAPDGECIGSLNIGHTKNEYRELTTQVKPVAGVHDLYFVFRATNGQQHNLFNWDWWQMSTGSQAAGHSAYVDSEGFLQKWMLLEPISNGLKTNAIFTDSYLRDAFGKTYFKDQLSIMPKDGQTVKAGKEKLKWHAYTTGQFNVKLFRFAANLKKPVYGVLFWGVTVIDAPEDMTVRLAVGSNSASQWWLNGKEALMLSGDRRMVKDDCVSRPLKLKKGRNVLRGAVINGPGMSDFCARFIDSNGQAVRNISIGL